MIHVSPDTDSATLTQLSNYMGVYFIRRLPTNGFWSIFLYVPSSRESLGGLPVLIHTNINSTP